MSSKMFLSALAVVTAVAVIAAPQDPSFEFPGAKHVGFDLPKEESTFESQHSDKVSVSFKNASIREVLDWLKDQGVNFVVGDDQLDKGGRININVVNQPVEEFMRALAGAWNGGWEKRNGIWVFHKGRDAFRDGLTRDNKVFFDGGVDGTFKSSDVLIPNYQGNLSKEDQEKLRKSFEKMGDPKKWEEFQKHMEQWSKDHEKGFKDHQKAMEELQKTLGNKDFQYKLDKKHVEEMRKMAEEMAKKGQQFKFEPGQHGFQWDGKDYKPMTEKQMEELHKQFGKDGRFFKFEPGQEGFKWDGKTMKPFTQKELEEMKKLGKNGKMFKFEPGQHGAFKWDGKDMKPLDEKHMKELQKHMFEMSKDVEGRPVYTPGKEFKFDFKGMNDKEMKLLRDRAGTRLFRDGSPFTGAVRSGHNLKAIYESLTPAQEQKLKRLGYINYSDLNANQRALLGVITDDGWTITYKTDTANLTIKSDR